MPKTFLGKKLLFITAHPDDESYAVSGTINANNQAGGESYLICATLGERGKGHLLKPLTKSQLKRTRKKELEKASRFLKIKRLFILNLPDGGVTERKSEAYKKITPIVQELKPDYLLSFGKDGGSGHLDHIAIGEVAKKIAVQEKIPFIAFAMSPQRLKILRSNPQLLTRRRRFGKYAKIIVPAKPNVKIKIDGRVKRKAVSFHKTQMGGRKPFSSFPKKLAKEWLSHEYFRQD